MTTATPSTAACKPCIVHWHLRKCAGTAIRQAFMTRRGPGGGQRVGQRYIEVHAEHQRFVGELRRARRRCCAVRTLVVLREPFAQLVSEMDFFPRDFSPELARPGAGPWWRTPWFEIREDHLVCEHGALMGLCECASVQQRQCRRERCNATSVVQRLRTEFDHIGIVGATMGCTYSILARWMAEGGGLSDPDDAEVVRMLEWRARWSERRARNTSARLSRFYEIQSDMPSPFPPPPPGRDAIARPENRRRRRPLRRQGTPQHLALLQHLPSRAEFDAHNACANEVVASLRRELGVCTPWKGLSRPL